MQEPRLAEMESGEIEEFYADPDMETLREAADNLRHMERIVELTDRYRAKKRQHAMADELLEQGYGPDEHVGFYQLGDDEYRVLDDFVVEDRRETTAEDMERIEQQLLEEVGELRAWGEAVEEGDGPVQAVTVAYGVVNDTFSPGSEANEVIEELRDDQYEDYEVLDTYATERDTLKNEADALDHFVSRDGRFKRDGLFGTVTDLMLDWEREIDRLYEEEAEKGRTIVETAQERLERREDGDEPVQPWDYELGMELQEDGQMDTASGGEPRYVA